MSSDDAPDDDLIEHVLWQQIDPQIRAERLRAEGLDVDAVFVRTDAEANGFQVACVRCGRRARLSFEPPIGRVAICPDCIRALDDADPPETEA